MKKFISILLTIAMMAVMMSPVLANDLPTVNPNYGAIEDTNAQTIANKILGIIQWFGYIIGFAMLLYIGIKYMMSAANDKADMKKALIGYVIGAIILFGASTIIGLFKGNILD